MAHSDRGDEARSLKITEWVAASAAVVAAVSVLGPALGLKQGEVLALTVPALCSGVLGLLAARRALATRTIPVRVAVGGAEGVGKTVYSNVVTSRLSEGESEMLRFTPETKTALHVYQVVNDLRRERWPGKTDRANMDRFRGTLEPVRQSRYSRVIQGRVEIDLEIGDSAGELWSAVGSARPDRPPWLIESGFFQYVGESSALLYFIPADAVLSDPGRVADHVDDLLSTVVALRNIEARSVAELAKPVGVVISKADLLDAPQLETLMGVFDGADTDVPDRRPTEPRFLASVERLEHLTVVLARQERAFRGFVVSALLATRAGARTSELAAVERPIEWVVRQTMRS